MLLVSRFWGDGRFDADQGKGRQFLKEFPRTGLRQSEIFPAHGPLGTTSALNPEDFLYCCTNLRRRLLPLPVPILIQSTPAKANTSFYKQVFFWITVETFRIWEIMLGHTIVQIGPHLCLKAVRAALPPSIPSSLIFYFLNADYLDLQAPNKLMMELELYSQGAPPLQLTVASHSLLGKENLYLGKEG